MSRTRIVPIRDYIIAAVIFVAGIGAILLSIHTLTTPKDTGSTAQQQFEIEKGESVKSIADRLQSEGLVRSSLGFRIAVKKAGLGNRIQAGVYELSPAMSAAAVADKLTLGRSDVRLTIPEGYRLEEVAETVEAVLGIERDEFMRVAGGLEGRLFPDTYFFGKGATADQVVGIMSDTFNKKVADLKPTEEDLVLASLVERETKGDAEKPIVAGILKKRLAAGWPLELDATIQYMLGKKGSWWPETTLLDRKIASPYNTYLHGGLPPGPIGSPGISSIEAVVKPAGSEYWFYLHDEKGVIHYARTNAEHEDNIAEYIR